MLEFNSLDYLKNDKELQREYLLELINNYLFDENSEAFLSALKPMIELNGSITEFAKKSKINRTYFYKMFSNKVKPDFSTITKIIKTFGFDITINLSAA